MGHLRVKKSTRHYLSLFGTLAVLVVTFFIGFVVGLVVGRIL
jgi:hypothetical protein